MRVKAWTGLRDAHDRGTRHKKRGRERKGLVCVQREWRVAGASSGAWAPALKDTQLFVQPLPMTWYSMMWRLPCESS